MSQIGILNQDLVQLPTGQNGPVWGLYQSGAPVILADNVVAFEYHKEFVNADYPVEPGPNNAPGPLTFENYDKVERPFAVLLTFSKGGNDADRANFLSSIDAATNTTQLFDAYTPEKLYQSISSSRIGTRRVSNSGVGLITVEVWFDQIRVTASATTNQNTQDASGAGQVNGGNVQGGSLNGQQGAALNALGYGID